MLGLWRSWPGGKLGARAVAAREKEKVGQKLNELWEDPRLVLLVTEAASLLETEAKLGEACMQVLRRSDASKLWTLLRSTFGSK